MLLAAFATLAGDQKRIQMNLEEEILRGAVLDESAGERPALNKRGHWPGNRT
jgi:hypothetical protein